MNKTEFCEAAWDSHFSQVITSNPQFLNFSSYNQFLYSIHISQRHKFIYFDIPKNASSSIKMFLQMIEHGTAKWRSRLFAEVHDRTFSPLLTPFQVSNFEEIVRSPEYFRFCIFRNPLERLLSSYLDQVLKNKLFVADINRFTGSDSDLPPTFKAFIYWICSQNVAEMDIHIKPQFYQSFLYAVSDMQVFRFDKLHLLESAIGTHIGNSAFTLPLLDGHKTNSHDLMQQYSDAQTLRVVRAKFAMDYAIWDTTAD